MLSVDISDISPLGDALYGLTLIKLKQYKYEIYKRVLG